MKTSKMLKIGAGATLLVASLYGLYRLYKIYKSESENVISAKSVDKKILENEVKEKISKYQNTISQVITSDIEVVEGVLTEEDESILDSTVNIINETGYLSVNKGDIMYEKMKLDLEIRHAYRDSIMKRVETACSKLGGLNKSTLNVLSTMFEIYTDVSTNLKDRELLEEIHEDRTKWCSKTREILGKDYEPIMNELPVTLLEVFINRVDYCLPFTDYNVRDLIILLIKKSSIEHLSGPALLGALESIGELEYRYWPWRYDGMNGTLQFDNWTDLIDDWCNEMEGERYEKEFGN